MENRHLYIPSFLLCAFLLAGCSGEKKEKEEEIEEGVSVVLSDTKSEVEVTTLRHEVFHHELVSNGKVAPRGMADLRFQAEGEIAQVFVKNGDRVKKGQKLAELDRFRLENNLIQMKDALDRAELDMQDILIGQGHGRTPQNKVPVEIMQLARTKSGFDQSKAQYELALHELKHATLTAPFEGVVANLFLKPHNMSSTTDAFCTIIDSRGMEVEFSVLENELSLIKRGDKVVIAPYSNTATAYDGNITEINPLVDDKGMVRAVARVSGSSDLFTGMNVRVSVQRSLGEQLVVPKSAVVLRSGKQVVFTLVDGKAYWNYVKTGLENAGYYTVTEGLKEGDAVITKGNINLAHEAVVDVTYK